MTLRNLHEVLQVAMEWEDCHLHEFDIESQRYGERHPDDWVSQRSEFTAADCFGHRKASSSIWPGNSASISSAVF
jgi:Plasmid pRiA4b ORF-3-like protein